MPFWGNCYRRVAVNEVFARGRCHQLLDDKPGGLQIRRGLDPKGVSVSFNPENVEWRQHGAHLSGHGKLTRPKRVLQVLENEGATASVQA